MIVLGLMAMVGCATTSIKSVTDPERGTNQYTKLLVIELEGDLIKTKKVEQSFKKKFEKGGINIQLGSELFLPTRKYSEKQIDEMVIKSGVEAVLVANLTEKNVSSTTYTPGSSSFGYVDYTSGAQGKTETEASRVLSLFYKSHTIYLVDVSTQKVVWTAATQSTGGAYSSSVLVGIFAPVALNSMMTNSFVGNVYKQLVKDGFLYKPPKNIKTQGQ
jgi:hypothetical protein